MTRLAGLPKLGYRKPEAAAFVGVSTTKFDALVASGRMPAPRRIDGCVIWRADELIDAFHALTGGEVERNGFDERLGL